jgi:protease-4
MRSLLHKFAFGVWSMRPGADSAYLPQVHAIIHDRQAATPTPLEEKELMAEADLRFVTKDGRTVYPSREQLEPQPGLVMVLDIKGAIMKEDFCGAPGTTTMAKWLALAEGTPEVDGVVLNMDSPGGDGYGMFGLASAIEKMSKPVVGYVGSGMACSACYGIGASCDQLLSGSSIDEFGSIGTYVQLRDWSGADEKWGVKTHTITATRSKQKLKAVHEALKADPKDPDDKHYQLIREQRIDPFNEAFIALVQKNRPAVKDEGGVFEGRVYMADEAKTRGLIDDTNKTLNDAIDLVRDLKKQQTPN